MDFIRITALTDIGNNIAYSSLIPVVDMAGTPTTKKANLQIVGNLILNGAGGSYFAPAARSVLAQSVTNAAQPNITSVGTLSNLAVSGNVNLGAVGNITITGGTAGQLLSTNGNGNLSWVSQPAGTYGNSNVASYLPTYTGTVGANRISSTPASGSNVEISANGAVFTFAQGGALYWPASAGNQWVIEPNIDNEFEIKSTSNVVISTDTSNANSHFTFDSDGIFTAPSNVNLLGSRLNVGPDAANAANLLNPTLVIANSGSQYIQAAIINNDPSGSADLSADGAGGGDQEAWTDMGFAGYTFNDANYTITEPGDGYLFVQGYANGLGGNMVLATGDHSNTADIVFATGGFLANNEFARIEHSNNLFHLTRAGSGIQFADGSIQTTAGGGGSTGNITFSNTTISTSIANADINLVGSNSGNIHVDSNNHIFLHVDDTVDPHGGLEMTWARTSNGVTQTAGISINTDFGNTELATGNVQIVACSNLANGLANSSWTFGTNGTFYLPGAGEKSIFTGPNSQMVLHSDTDIRIITDIYDSSRQFVFDQFGDFFAPGNVTLDGTSVLVGQGANTLGLADATLVISSNSNAYVQAVINNVSDAGSADWVAQGRLGSDLGGYVDLGFNSSGFGDPEYSAMGPGDGYLYTEGYADGQAPLPTGGNLVIGTGSQGLTRDVIFTTGGHTTDNIIARFSDANNLFELSRANSGIKFPDGSIQTTAAGNGGLPLSNGNSIINIATLDGNITLDSNGNVFTFGTDGNLTTPSNLVIGPGMTGGSTLLQYDSALQVVGEGSNAITLMGWAANQSTPDSIAVIGMNTPYSNGAANLLLAVGNNATTVNYWNFANDGTTTFPTLTVDLHNGGNQAGQVLKFGDDSQQAIITGPTPDVDVNAQRLIIQGQRGNGTGEGGDVYLWGGDADLGGGDIKIYAGDADNVSAGSGGYVNIAGGDGFDFGGYARMTAGSSANGQGAFAAVIGGQGGTQGGTANLEGGYGSVSGGDTWVKGGFGAAGPGGNTYINGGASANGANEGGNIIFTSGISTWYMDNTGNLILAGGNSVIGSVANSSLDPINPNVSTMIFTPDAGYSSQSLVLDPTAPGHIHLRAPGANIDEPYANIFLGGEDSSFEVGYYTSSAPNVFIHSGGNTWTFDNTGNITTPGNISLSTANGIIDASSNLEIYSGTDGNNGAYLALGSGSGNIGGDISIISGEGTVTTGGNIILQGGIGNTKGGNATLQGGSGLGAGGDGGDVEIVGGIANVGGLSGNITLYSGVNQWKFDNSGNLTIPSNTIKINFANGSPAFANLVQWTTAPVANTSAGTAGQAAYDSGGNLYVCVSTNTWAKFSGTTSW